MNSLNILGCRNLQDSTPISSLTRTKKSPSRRSKSRWEPLPEKTLVEKPVSASIDSLKHGGWDRKVYSRLLLSVTSFVRVINV